MLKGKEALAFASARFYATRSFAPRAIRRAATIISTTSATAREFPSSHAFHVASLCAARSGAATTATIGAATVIIEVTA